MHGGWLHVVCGDSAAGSLRASGAVDPSAVRVQHDVLSVGPLPPRDDLSTWRGMRHAFWCTIWPEAPEFAELSEDLVAGADQLGGATGVALWIGGSLSDQLLLPSTDWIAGLVGADTVPMAVVRFPGNGLGTRSPQALRPHPAPLPRKNVVDHNGIDTWVAGVHLDASAGRVWFWQGAGLVRAEA